MIFTVFPMNDWLPQDFETYEEAKEYAETWLFDCGYEIEWTE